MLLPEVKTEFCFVKVLGHTVIGVLNIKKQSMLRQSRGKDTSNDPEFDVLSSVC